MITLYGIPNCDSVRKARDWLEAHAIEYQFHDYRDDGLDLVQLLGWVKALGWETMLNRQGRAWRKLTDKQREEINEHSAIQHMLDEPTLIKRPLLDLDGCFHVGFSEDKYRELFR